MTIEEPGIEISAIICVGERSTDCKSIYSEYKSALDDLKQPYEFIFVLDGYQPDFREQIQELHEQGEQITVIGLSRRFGEAAALMVGFENSSGRIILTLPAYHQIDASKIFRLVNGVGENDFVSGCRFPRRGRTFDRFRRTAFHALVKGVTGLRFDDLGCKARCFDRRVLEEISLYGEQQRFLPLLADRRGFRVAEVQIPQSCRDYNELGYSLREYLRSSLDIITVFFLTKFTKRPLRFFGTSGVLAVGVGGLIIAWMVYERLVLRLPLADRPALILASLLVVLGLQLFALGLLGELIIFTHAREDKDYQVERIIKTRPSTGGDIG